MLFDWLCCDFKDKKDFKDFKGSMDSARINRETCLKGEPGYFLQLSMTKRSKSASDLPPDLKARSRSSIRSNTSFNSLIL